MTKRGSRNLANSTMETFVQPAGCLDCHAFNTHMLGGTDGLGHGAGLSHIYGVLNGVSGSMIGLSQLIDDGGGVAWHRRPA